MLKVFTDAGASGRTTKRTELQAMLAYCKKYSHKIRAVVVQDVSRLAREVHGFATIVRQLEELGIVVESATEPFVENKTAAGRLTSTVLAGTAQFQSDSASEKIRARMKSAYEQGRFLNVAPLGYRNTTKNGLKNIAPDPERAELVRKLFELVASGVPVESARRQVNAIGLRTRRGREVPKQTFAQMLRNPLYWGLIKTRQVEAMGVFEPLITEKLFQQVQDVIAGKRGARPKKHNKINAEFPLRGFLLCAECRRPLTAGFVKGKYATMWCWNPKCDVKMCARRETLETNFVLLLNSIQPTAEFVASLPQLSRELFKERAKRLAGERKGLVQKLNDQGTLNSKAVTARVEDKISAEDFAGMKIAIKNASDGYTEQIKLIDSETSTLESLMAEASEAVVNLAVHWKKVGLTQKQELQRAMFPDGLLVSKEKGYFEHGNTSLMEMCTCFFNSIPGSVISEAFLDKFGRGERI